LLIGIVHESLFGLNNTLDMGDIPNSEVGMATEGITRPKYDKQLEYSLLSWAILCIIRISNPLNCRRFVDQQVFAIKHQRCSKIEIALLEKVGFVVHP
jgi:hypothetical protein